MKFALGFGAGIAAAIAFLRPELERGDGTGSDRRGDYDFEWLLLSFARNTFELRWWSS